MGGAWLGRLVGCEIESCEEDAGVSLVGSARVGYVVLLVES